jgi:hypothetical protein
MENAVLWDVTQSSLLDAINTEFFYNCLQNYRALCPSRLAVVFPAIRTSELTLSLGPKEGMNET